jgi:ABC-type glucose/galactose transport system permease subunit
MAYQPPFTITTDILNLVAQISQQVGELNASQLNASPQLRKQNRIKTITGTLAIEGNSLTEEQITAIVEGKPVLGSVRELAEVKGAIAAYDALPTFTPSAINDLLTAHGLMLSDILVNAGEKAAMFSGIRTDRMKFLIYVLAGAITGFAAFINVIKVGSVTSSGGNQLETQILIALVLGGMPISGGAKVRFENIIVGSLLYIVLNSGLTMMGFSTQMMQLIQGIVFLIFVAVFADRESIQVIK